MVRDGLAQTKNVLLDNFQLVRWVFEPEAGAGQGEGGGLVLAHLPLSTSYSSPPLWSRSPSALYSYTCRDIAMIFGLAVMEKIQNLQDDQDYWSSSVFIGMEFNSCKTCAHDLEGGAHRRQGRPVWRRRLSTTVCCQQYSCCSFLESWAFLKVR